MQGIVDAIRNEQYNLQVSFFGKKTDVTPNQETEKKQKKTEKSPSFPSCCLLFSSRLFFLFLYFFLFLFSSSFHFFCSFLSFFFIFLSSLFFLIFLIFSSANTKSRFGLSKRYQSTWSSWKSNSTRWSTTCTNW